MTPLICKNWQQLKDAYPFKNPGWCPSTRYLHCTASTKDKLLVNSTLGAKFVKDAGCVAIGRAV